MKGAALFVCACAAAVAVARAPNYVEAQVAPYTLPDPLTFADGRRVASPADWAARRREIVAIFAREMYGRIPPPPEAVVSELREEGPTCAGLGIRRQYRVWFRADRSGPFVDWLVLLPNRIAGLAPRRAEGRIVCENAAKCPVVLFLNYAGNHTLVTDEEVEVPPQTWLRAGRGIGDDHRPVAAQRGAAARHDTAAPFPVEMILARGYAVLTACYGQVSPDTEVRKGLPEELAYTGIFALWPPRDPARDDNITALGAWAWMLSRGLDLASTIPEIDAARSVATGFSRLGKAALLACSRDERFAVCVPNQTGGGGVPLAKRDFGENVSTEMASFPHWYCKAYGKYVDNEAALPFDQHWLVASIAPRAILVQGFNSPWFDARGEYLSCRAASPVWEALGRQGLPAGDFPDNFDTSAIGPYLGYVRRGGAHGMAGYDWRWALDFADRVFQSAARQAP